MTDNNPLLFNDEKAQAMRIISRLTRHRRACRNSIVNYSNNYVFTQLGGLLLTLLNYAYSVKYAWLPFDDIFQAIEHRFLRLLRYDAESV